MSEQFEDTKGGNWTEAGQTIQWPKDTKGVIGRKQDRQYNGQKITKG
jgi:hypothetical protein